MSHYLIRELRDMTGLTQKKFAGMYGIPLSTLRKWEQGESSPPVYVIGLLENAIPAADSSLLRISGRKGEEFFYDRLRRTVSDRLGNRIRITEDPGKVKEQNLKLYLEELFEGFYEIQEKFNRDCRFDQEDDIIWTRREE